MNVRFPLFLALAFGSAISTTSRRSPAEPPPTEPHVMTALDDTRACTPLAAGGWAVATGGGLAIVDRNGVTHTLTSLDGLPDTRVHAVAESADGLWVGTEGGAALVAGGAVVRTAAPAGVPVHAVHVATTNGAIFLGTWGGGVYRLADKAAPPVLVPGSGAGKHVAAIAEHHGVVHVAYGDGPVARLEGPSLTPLTDSPTHGQALASIGTQLLLGDVEGVYRIQDGRVHAVASVDTRAIASTSSGAWIGTFGSGLLSWQNNAVGGRAEAGLPRWVRGVAARGGVSCAATTEGVYVDDGSSRWHALALGASLPSNDVTTLAVSRGGARVAVGTFDRGAAIFDGSRFQRIAGLERDETVNAAAWQGEGADARLWLATARGLVKVDASGKILGRLRGAEGLPSSIVRSVLVVSPSSLLVGTEEGAAFVEGDRARPVASVREKGTKASLASPMHATWALARDSAGTLYLGTATGLYYGKDGKFARASVSSSELPDDWVTALAVREDGGATQVFAGTYSRGVSRLTFSVSAKTPVAALLGGGYVNPDGLTIHGTTLVASTMDGLALHPLASAASDWTTKPKASTGRDVTAARVVGGSLWVASRRGIEATALGVLGI